MNTDGIFEIALFPIPGCVTFPQMVMPLHVFEPRYRQMIKDCVDNRKLLGVCQTKGIERFAPRIVGEIIDKEDLDTFYKQNLTTFSPEDVFSAGTVEITEMTDDGRYAVNINMLKRFRILELVQDSPYKIAKCEEYGDSETVEFKNSEEAVIEQKEFILSFLSEQMTKLGYDDKNILMDIYEETTVNKFTFRMFQYIRMEDHEMQSILNSKNPIERMNSIYEFVKNLGDLLS